MKKTHLLKASAIGLLALTAFFGVAQLNNNHHQSSQADKPEKAEKTYEGAKAKAYLEKELAKNGYPKVRVHQEKIEIDETVSDFDSLLNDLDVDIQVKVESDSMEGPQQVYRKKIIIKQ